MIPHPSSAVQIGTFIGRGRHLRGSRVKKNSVKNNNGDAQCTLGRACGGRRDVKGFAAKDLSNKRMMVGWAHWEMHLVGCSMGWVWPDFSENAYRLGKACWQKSLRRIPSAHRINPKRCPERPQEKSQAISQAATG